VIVVSGNRRADRWSSGLIGAFVALAFLCVVGVSGASAQDMQTGHVIRQAERAKIEKEGSSRGEAAWRTVVAFSECTLAKHRNDVAAWLRKPDDRKALNRLIDEECLDDGELQFAHNIIRGGLYTAMYRRDFRRESAPLILAPLDVSQVATATGDPTFQDLVTLLTFADCIVRRDVPSARNLVLAVPGTERAASSFQQLSRHFQVCLTQGSQLKFSKTILVGLIAEALYRESATQSQGMVSSEGKTR
jgi:hypothetical protein